MKQIILFPLQLTYCKQTPDNCKQTPDNNSKQPNALGPFADFFAINDHNYYLTADVVNSEYNAMFSDDTENNGSPLEKGMHLHWQLPEFFARGTASDQEDKTLSFPNAPNRWLIKRTLKTGGTKLWLIESDYLEDVKASPKGGSVCIMKNSGDTLDVTPYSLGRVSDYPECQTEDQNKASALYSEHFTLMGIEKEVNDIHQGHLYFSSIYSNCRNVLGFHDDSEGWDNAQSYEVFGYYQDTTKDQLQVLLNKSQPITCLKSLNEILSTYDLEIETTTETIKGISSLTSITYAKLLPNGDAPALGKKKAIAIGRSSEEALGQIIAQGIGGDEKEANSIKTNIDKLQLNDKLKAKTLDFETRLQNKLHQSSFYVRHTDQKTTVSKPATLSEKAKSELEQHLDRLNRTHQQRHQEAQTVENDKQHAYALWYFYQKKKREGAGLYLALINQYLHVFDQLVPARSSCNRLYYQHRAHQAAFAKSLNTHSPGQTPTTVPTQNVYQSLDPAIAYSQAREPSEQQTDKSQLQCLLVNCPDPVQPLNTNTIDAISQAAAKADKFSGITDSNQTRPLDTLLKWSLHANNSYQSPTTREDKCEVAKYIIQTIGGNVANNNDMYYGTGKNKIAINVDNILETEPLLSFQKQLQEVQDTGNIEEYFYTGSFATYVLNMISWWQNGTDKDLFSDSGIYYSNAITSCFYLDDNGADLKPVPPKSSSKPSSTQPDNVYLAGSTPISSHASAQLSNKLKQDDPYYKDINNYQKTYNTITQTLTGFNDALRQQCQTLSMPLSKIHVKYNQTTQGKIGQRMEANQITHTLNQPRFGVPFMPIFFGSFDIDKLEMVDNFGQIRNIPISSKEGSYTGLAPRLTFPAQLDFKFCSSTLGTPPIYGWLAINEIEGSLFVFDTLGEALCELYSTGNNKVQARKAPGPAGCLPAAIKDTTLNQVVTQLLTDNNYFTHFMATVQSGIDNTHPEKLSTASAMSVITSRPVAVTAADIQLKAPQGLPVDLSDDGIVRSACAEHLLSNNLQAVKFPVRIGDYNRLNSGLIGYWPHLSPDDNTFIATAADNPIDTTLKIYNHTNSHTKTDLNLGNICLSFGQNEPTKLIMLVDPHAPIYATSGILPESEIEFSPSDYSDALEKISYYYLTAPLLTGNNQQYIDLTLPAIPGHQWQWLEKNNDGDWITTNRQFRNFQLNTDAYPAASENQTSCHIEDQVLREGWLQLTPED